MDGTDVMWYIVSTRMSVALKTATEEAAAAAKVTRSEWIRETIRRALAEQNKEVPA